MDILPRDNAYLPLCLLTITHDQPHNAFDDGQKVVRHSLRIKVAFAGVIPELCRGGNPEYAAHREAKVDGSGGRWNPSITQTTNGTMPIDK